MQDPVATSRRVGWRSSRPGRGEPKHPPNPWHIVLVIGALAVVLLLAYAVASVGHARAGLPLQPLLLSFLALFAVLAGLAAGAGWWLGRRWRGQTLQHDRQAIDAQLRKAKEDAEAASLAKSRFMAGLSHELRTPLNSILGYAQILQHDASLPPKRRAAVDVIHRNGRYLVGLIDGMLDISRIEAGKLRLDNAPLALPAFLAQIADMFSQQATEKGLTFDYQPSAGLPQVVLVDEKRLGQILINLLGNAVKYTSQGRVCLRVRYVSQVAHFEVSDTGAGIPAQDLERIFQPFERSWAASRQADTGTGLGLTICNLLAHLMGGDLAVQSQQGQGSVFTLRLFLPQRHSASDADVPRQAARRIMGYQGPRRRVLVVDDQIQQRRVLDDMLTPLGFEISQADHGEACLQALAAQSPDIVLMDMSMPGMSGLEVCARAREQGFRQPIVLVSADLSVMAGDDHDQGLAYVPKPVLLELLLAKMGDMLALEWQYAAAPQQRKAQADALPAGSLSDKDAQTLLELAAIGYVKGMQDHLRGLRARQPELTALADQLEGLLEDFRLEAFVQLLRDHQRRADTPARQTEESS